MTRRHHTLLVPVYNEEASLDALRTRIVSVLKKIKEPYEVIMVKDGSSDGSVALLDKFTKEDSRFKAIHLSRNFGQQVAITAGLQFSTGMSVTILDADLQDPPELLGKMLEKWNEGYQVVYSVRRSRDGESFLKKATAKIFYRLIRSITKENLPVNVGDFRLIDRKVVEALLQIPERNRYLRGLVSWVGFKQTGIEYDRESRFAGKTHYSFWKMVRFALDGITSFSVVPLRWAGLLGFVTSFLSALAIGYSLYAKLVAHHTVDGWTSLLSILSFFAGAQLLTLGVIGEYLGRVYDEVRRRPLYLVDRVEGFSERIEKPRRRAA